MPEKLKEVIKETLSGVAGLWRRLTGNSGHEVQEVKVRIFDPRRVALDNARLRRAPRSGPDCRY